VLIELCRHTAVPGKLEAFLARLTADGVAIRAGHGARLLFLTVGDSGRLNEVVLAWAHDSIASFAQMRQRLGDDRQWQAWERSGSVFLQRQERRLMETTSFTRVTLPPAGTRLIDLRTYSFKPGGITDFLPVCESAGFPLQQRHCGALVFHAVSSTGAGDQLVQAWAYPDHDRYQRGQVALFRDPQWASSYRERVIHLVQEQEHRYLKALAASPVGSPAVEANAVGQAGSGGSTPGTQPSR
jgi:hypothetical protein